MLMTIGPLSTIILVVCKKLTPWVITLPSTPSICVPTFTQFTNWVPATSRQGGRQSGCPSRCLRMQSALHGGRQLARAVWEPLAPLTEGEHHHKARLEIHPEHIVSWAWCVTQHTGTARPAFHQEVVKGHRLIDVARDCQR